MPMYEYKCPECEKIYTELRTIDERNDPVNCTTKRCGGLAKLIFSSPIIVTNTDNPDAFDNSPKYVKKITRYS